MKWLFIGKFSEIVGQDYIYKCDKCENKIQVKDITDIPHRKFGKIKQYFCPNCKEVEKWDR